jgi:hypothetical protein
MGAKMKYMFFLLFSLVCSGCTLIGFLIGATQVNQEIPVEKREQDEQVKIYQKNKTEQKGRFVSFEFDTLQLAVDSPHRLNATDTLAFPLAGIQHIKKEDWSTAWQYAGIGLMIDCYVAVSLTALYTRPSSIQHRVSSIN